MQFCNNCGGRIRPKQIENEEKSTVVLACTSCGQEVSGKAKPTGVVLKPEQPSKPPIKILEGDDIKTLPTTNIECPKCGKNEAFWWFILTRSGDEPATQFYRCTSCNHTWRIYS